MLFATWVELFEIGKRLSLGRVPGYLGGRLGVVPGRHRALPQRWEGGALGGLELGFDLGSRGVVIGCYSLWYVDVLSLTPYGISGGPGIAAGYLGDECLLESAA